MSTWLCLSGSWPISFCNSKSNQGQLPDKHNQVDKLYTSNARTSAAVSSMYSQQVYNLVIFFVWKSFTYSYWRHYQPISSHLSSIEEENNLGHILYIFISLTLGRVQVFCQILSNKRGFKELILNWNVTQIVLFLYWAKMTAHWLVVSPVRVCKQFSYKKNY